MGVRRMAKERFVRSEDYRSRYIAAHPGWKDKWYLCPYCGRFVAKDRMQVDHIISIDLANRQSFYRRLVPKAGINSEKNLTAACGKCNLKKSNQGGWWIVRAKIGRAWYMIVWVLLIALTTALLGGILCGFLTPQTVRNWFGQGLLCLTVWLHQYINIFLDAFLNTARQIYALAYL